MEIAESLQGSADSSLMTAATELSRLGFADALALADKIDERKPD